MQSFNFSSAKLATANQINWAQENKDSSDPIFGDYLHCQLNIITVLKNHLKSLIYRVSGVFISDKADIDKPWSSSIDVLKNRCSSSLSSDPPTLSTKMIFERVEKSVSVLVYGKQC